MRVFRSWPIAAAAILYAVMPISVYAQQAGDGVTAHRGNSFEYPENTMAAFRSAIELGVDQLEVDVRKTSDGHLVLIHDGTTKAVGDRVLTVADSTLAQLREVDVASVFRRSKGLASAQMPAERMPTLDEVIDLVKTQSRTRLIIDCKADLYVECLALIDAKDAVSLTGFIAHRASYLRRVKDHNGNLSTTMSLAPGDNLDNAITEASSGGFDSLLVHYSDSTADAASKIAAAGLDPGVWTVNDITDLTAMLCRGFERIYTDYPARLLRLKELKPDRESACLLLDTIDSAGIEKRPLLGPHEFTEGLKVRIVTEARAQGDGS